MVRHSARVEKDTAVVPGPVKVFVCYAPEDRIFCDELQKTFRDLEDSGIIDFWTDQELLPGDNKEEEIQQQLEGADWVVLLISRDLLGSEYLNREEVKRCLDGHKKKQRVIPIIARKCDWMDRFGRLKPLPAGAAIREYKDADDAWYDIRLGLKKLLQTPAAAPEPVEIRPSLGAPASATPGENVSKWCDRSAQQASFEEFVIDAAARRPGQPQLFVLVEDDVDRPEYLIDRLYEVQIAQYAAEKAGAKRASCPRFSAQPCGDTSLRVLQNSVLRRRSGLLDFTDPTLKLHSHVVYQQSVLGVPVAAWAKDFLLWFAGDFCQTFPLGTSSWILFLLLEFDSLNPKSPELRRKAFSELSTLFDDRGRRNCDEKDSGLPALLLAPPEELTAADIKEVIVNHFPVSSVREANVLAQKMFQALSARIGQAPRIDDVCAEIEWLRKQYQSNGKLEYERVA